MSKYVIHNGTFIELSDDELAHFKYVKRVRTGNGKWRYYYKNDGTALDSAKRAVSEATSEALKTDSAVLKAQAEYDEAVQLYDTASSRFKGAASVKLSSAEKQLKKATAESKKAYKKAERAIKKYERKKKSEFRASTISKGAVKVANWLSGLFG